MVHLLGEPLRCTSISTALNDSPVPKPPCTPGAPEKWFTAVRVFWTALLHTGGWTPRRKAQAMIRWYQTNISAGRNLCSNPEPYNCSNRVYFAVENYGVIVGALMLTTVLSCSDGPGENKGNCCGGGDHN